MGWASSKQQIVSLVKCASYEQDLVRESLHRAIDLLGGIEHYVRPGQRVVVKPNLLSPSPPEAAVTTHPALVEAVYRLVSEAGARPLVADSPNFSVPSTPEGLHHLYSKTGMLGLSQRTGIELNWDTGSVATSVPVGKVVKRLQLIKPCVDTDAIVAVPKLKTHALTTITGATKIMYGALHGLSKPGYHASLQRLDRFCELLLDILACLRPSLFVMDGILAMEGNGPGLHGRPRPMELILASADPIAMDVVVCRIIGIDPRRVAVLKAAISRGWWDGDPESVPVVGDPIESVAVDDFRLPTTALDAPSRVRMVPWVSFAEPLIKTALLPTPSPRPELCTGCGSCAKACPEDAITIAHGLAMVDGGKCIHCYCCHEICPEAAIDLRLPWWGKLIRRVMSASADSLNG